MNEALGLLEISSWSVAMAALDAAEKAARVRVLQLELNDLYGVSARLQGALAEVERAVEIARSTAEQLRVPCIADVIGAPDARARASYQAPPERNPLIEQEVVFLPRDPWSGEDGMNQETPFAIGFIETQGFTAVIEAVDTACKAANVEVIGREKLGGGYITVLVKGDVAAVTTAIEAGRTRVEGLGKLIAAHVIARPSPAILSLLPKP